jgi:DNA-binding MarR family transcriptional regulator
MPKKTTYIPYDEDNTPFFKLLNCIAQSPLLTSVDKLLYSQLTGHLGENTKCWPSIALLAEELGLDRPAVNKSLKKMEAIKLIEITRFPDEPNRPNEYTFPDHKILHTYVE